MMNARKSVQVILIDGQMPQHSNIQKWFIDQGFVHLVNQQGEVIAMHKAERVVSVYWNMEAGNE